MKFSCVADIAAKITGTTRKEVYNTLKVIEGHLINDREFIYYLLIHGFICGIILFPTEKITSKNLVLDASIDLLAQPAYFKVLVGENKLPHAIYWDGYQLFDPNPNVNNLQLSDYDIVQVTPIYKIDGDLPLRALNV